MHLSSSSSFRDGFLSATSTLCHSVGPLLPEHADLGFFAASWDRRSVCITSADQLRLEHSVLVALPDSDPYGRQRENSLELECFAKTCSSTTERYEISNRDLEPSWSNFANRATQVASSLVANLRRPLRILIDCNGWPRYLWIATIVRMIRSGLASKISVFYSEGFYDSLEQEEESVEFTRGRWKILHIPGLRGYHDPGAKKCFVVSVGFEGALSLRVVSREDPDRLAILYPEVDQGSRYYGITRRENQLLERRYAVPDSFKIGAPAGDAVAAWKALTEKSIERPEDENTFYLCFGTKPHALALSLRALCHSFPTVIYKRPGAYTYATVTPSGRYWRFDILDRTSYPPLVPKR